MPLTWGPPRAMATIDAVGGSPPQGRVQPGEPAGVRILTWNVSHWTAAKADIIAGEVNADVLAVQETHLAVFPLECAHGTARRVGLHLQHGAPVPAVAQAVYGRSCCVGFVTQRGFPVPAVPPAGAAWRSLQAVGRLHVVRLAPRRGLPHGRLMLSVHAALQVRAQQQVRQRFVSAVLEVAHGLDMQVPTLILGDFNGSADPSRDFLSDSGKRRTPCPLLVQLLGPGAPWVDVHVALISSPAWTFQSLDSGNMLSASRIDLVLANHCAMGLIRSAMVLDTVRDGGHSPVLVELHFSGPLVIDWCLPRRRVPELLTHSSGELRQSAEWQELLSRWLSSPAMASALDAGPVSAAVLSGRLVAALEHLVSLAGGWTVRSAHRRLAYDSTELRGARRVLANLLRLSSLVRGAASGPPGCWPRVWEQLLDRLACSGVVLTQAWFIIGRRLWGLLGALPPSWMSPACSVCRLGQSMLLCVSTGWTVSCGDMLRWTRPPAGRLLSPPPLGPTFPRCRGLPQLGLLNGYAPCWGACGRVRRQAHWVSPWLCGGHCLRCGWHLWPGF